MVALHYSGIEAGAAVAVVSEVRGGTSKRDKRLKKRPRYRWEDNPPPLPNEVLHWPTGRQIEPPDTAPLAAEIEAVTAKAAAVARESLDREIARRQKRKQLLIDFLAKLDDDD